MSKYIPLMKTIPYVMLATALFCGTPLRAATIQESASVASPLNMGIELQYVPAQYRYYDWVGGQTTRMTGGGARLGFEWIPLEQFGKLGVGAGVGFAAIKNAEFGGTRATLTTVPLEASLGYRLDYLENQPLIPFVKLGVSHTLAFQRGIDVPGSRGFWSFEKVVGLGLNLNFFDRKTARSWDRSWGVNATHFTAEYVRSDAIGKRRQPDLTYDMFRFGLRFEI